MEQDSIMASDPDKRMHGSGEPSTDEVTPSGLGPEEIALLNDLMEAKQNEEREDRKRAIALAKRYKELKDDLQRKIDDPSYDTSPWLATKAFTDAVKSAMDPTVDDRRRRQAEIVIQQRVTLHTAWKSRQLEQLIATRTDATARMVGRATVGLVIATGALVLATIGLIIATIFHHP